MRISKGGDSSFHVLGCMVGTPGTRCFSTPSSVVFSPGGFSSSHPATKMRRSGWPSPQTLCGTWFRGCSSPPPPFHFPHTFVPFFQAPGSLRESFSFSHLGLSFVVPKVVLSCWVFLRTHQRGSILFPPPLFFFLKKTTPRHSPPLLGFFHNNLAHPVVLPFAYCDRANSSVLGFPDFLNQFPPTTTGFTVHRRCPLSSAPYTSILVWTLNSGSLVLSLLRHNHPRIHATPKPCLLCRTLLS